MTEEKQIHIRRSEHAQQFVIIPNAIAQGPFSYEAIGMLTHLLSRPPDWDIEAKQLQRAGCRRDKVARILKELIDNNYMTIEELRDPEGQFAGLGRVVYDIPQTEKPGPVKPHTEEPDTVKPHLQKQTTALTTNNELQNPEEEQQQQGMAGFIISEQIKIVLGNLATEYINDYGFDRVELVCKCALADNKSNQIRNPRTWAFSALSKNYDLSHWDLNQDDQPKTKKVTYETIAFDEPVYDLNQQFCGFNMILTQTQFCNTLHFKLQDDADYPIPWLHWTLIDAQTTKTQINLTLGFHNEEDLNYALSIGPLFDEIATDLFNTTAVTHMRILKHHIETVSYDKTIEEDPDSHVTGKYAAFINTFEKDSDS